jgi:hypothetical protein
MYRRKNKILTPSQAADYDIECKPYATQAADNLTHPTKSGIECFGEKGQGTKSKNYTTRNR